MLRTLHGCDVCSDSDTVVFLKDRRGCLLSTGPDSGDCQRVFKNHHHQEIIPLSPRLHDFSTRQSFSDTDSTELDREGKVSSPRVASLAEGEMACPVTRKKNEDQLFQEEKGKRSPYRLERAASAAALSGIGLSGLYGVAGRHYPHALFILVDDLAFLGCKT